MTINKRSARVFKALADEKRIAILKLLQHGEQCACILLVELDLTQSGLSYHMKILNESGIISSRLEGKWTYYEIDPQGKRKFVELFEEITEIKN